MQLTSTLGQLRETMQKITAENHSLLNHLIRFLLAELIDVELFNLQKKILLDASKNPNSVNDRAWIELGYFSVNNFLIFMSAMGQVKNGISSHTVEIFLEKLKNEEVIVIWPNHLSSSNVNRYKHAGERSKYLFKKDLIVNVVGGWQYLLKKYENSIIKIEHENQTGDKSIGTGFYFAAGNDNFVKSLIITNKHVVLNAKCITVYSKNDEIIKHKRIYTDEKKDIGFIELECQLDVPILHLNPEEEVLSEIITIGYPAIPMMQNSYQVCHKGEINAYGHDLMGNCLLLISAKTSSGNSGSPIIDKYGMVMGIIAQDLFEQDQFVNKGKLPYYAGIPTTEIINSLNENVFK